VERGRKEKGEREQKRTGQCTEPNFEKMNKKTTNQSAFFFFYLAIQASVLVGRPLALKQFFARLVRTLELMTWAQIPMDSGLVVRQLLAARINLSTALDQTQPLEPKRLFLMQLFVPLKRQGVGQDCITTCIVASELDPNQPLLMIKHMSTDVVCTAKRRPATFDRTRQSFARFHLFAPQLVCSQASVRPKDLATALHRALELDPSISFSMDLKVILERFRRGQDLVALVPGARVLESYESAGMLEPVTRQVLGRSIRSIASGLGTLVHRA